jgi:DNA-binding NarL/FixJ family response regulator
MMKTVRVLLAEDHGLVRAGIRSLLQKLTWVDVVGEVSNGREALAFIRSHHPNVVLMDIAMPELNGLEAAGRIRKEFPHTKVIILSMHATEEYVLQALRAGANGYLLKDASTNELELAIQAVVKGENYLSPVVSKHVVSDYVRRSGAEPSSGELLTPRQREILQLIAEGNSTKEIAAKLNISVKTVETHRMQLMDRLKIHDVPGLVRYAIRIGLIRSEQ